MQIANVKQRQILPRMGKIWVSTPQNLASNAVNGMDCPWKCQSIFRFYYNKSPKTKKVAFFNTFK